MIFTKKRLSLLGLAIFALGFTLLVGPHDVSANHCSPQTNRLTMSIFPSPSTSGNTITLSVNGPGCDGYDLSQTGGPMLAIPGGNVFVQNVGQNWSYQSSPLISGTYSFLIIGYHGAIESSYGDADSVVVNALINVRESGCTGGTWNITPGNYTGTSNSVPAGQSYTLTSASVPNGCTLSSISNSVTGASNTMTVWNIETFTITYTVDTTPPPTPPLTATPGVCNSKQITLSWSDPSGTATSFIVKDGSTTIYTGSGTNHTHSGLTEGSSHTYTITASNSAGTSAPGGTNPSQTIAPPLCGGGPLTPSVTLNASPTNVSPGGASNLDWTTANVSSCNAGGSWSGSKSIGSGNQSTGALSGPATYTYTLSCTGVNGPASASATVTVGSSSGNPTPTLGGRPGACGSGSIILTWGAPGANTFSVWRDGTLIPPGNVSYNTMTDSGLTPGTNYNYMVAAYFLSGSPLTTTNSTSAKAPSACVPATATINASSNLAGTTWTINGATPGSGAYPSQAHSVSPGSGMVYTLTPSVVTGYTSSVSNSKTGNSNQATIFSGETVTFTVTYTLTSAPTVNITGRRSGTTNSYVDGPISVLLNGNVDLNWTSSGASSCTGSGGTSGWPGVKGIAGPQTGVGPVTSQPTTFSIDCNGGTDSIVVELSLPVTGLNVATGACGGNIDTSWNPAPGADSYVLRRSDTGVNGTFTTTFPLSGTTYTDSGLTPGNTYWYRVETISNGVSSFTTLPAPSARASNSCASAFDFNVDTIPSLSITQGQTRQATVNINYVSGTAENVGLSATGLPSGVSVSGISPLCLPTCSGWVNFDVSGSAPVGTYTITITGVSATSGVTRSDTLALTVNASVAPTVTVTVTPPAPKVNQTVTWIATASPLPCTYSWTGDVGSGSPTTASFGVVYNSTGTKNVQVVATCNGIPGSGSGSVYVGVNPLYQEF